MNSRTALVTGSSRGIGRAIAVALARDGVGVVGVHYASDKDAAQETARQVEAAGATAVVCDADLTADAPERTQQLAEAFLDGVERVTGERRVDVLVNNAGIAGPQELGAIDEATYRAVVEVNLTAPLFLTQVLLPHVARGGRVINVSSGYARIAAPHLPVYSATKGALNTLTLSLAPWFAARDVTVNSVMPGVIDTDMTAPWLATDPASAEALSTFGRVGTVADVADVVTFLASEKSRWITGQVIDITGGSRL